PVPSIKLTLRADNGQTVEKSIVVDLSSPASGAPRILTFQAEPASVPKGGKVTLKYSVQSARGLTLRIGGQGTDSRVIPLRKPGTAPADVADSYTVQPTVATDYELEEEGGQISRVHVA